MASKVRAGDVGISFPVPEGVAWFSVQKYVEARVSGKKGAKTATWEAQQVEATPGVLTKQIPAQPGLFVDGARELLRLVRESWGEGLYRIRWPNGATSMHFRIRPVAPDPGAYGADEEAPAASPAAPAAHTATVVPPSAPSVDMARLPPQVQDVFALSAAMRAMNRDEREAMMHANASMMQMFATAFQSLVGGSQHAAPAPVGPSAAEIKLAILEVVGPLRQENADLRAKLGQLEGALASAAAGAGGEAPDGDGDWLDELGNLLGDHGPLVAEVARKFGADKFLEVIGQIAQAKGAEVIAKGLTNGAKAQAGAS